MTIAERRSAHYKDFRPGPHWPLFGPHWTWVTIIRIYYIVLSVVVVIVAVVVVVIVVV